MQVVLVAVAADAEEARIGRRLHHADPGGAGRVKHDVGPAASSAVPVLVVSGARAAEGGHGLVGMRERATMLGGGLEAGPTGDGGFRVTAVLPVSPPEEAP